MHKFNCIRQVAPVCSQERTHCGHLANATEQSVYSGDAPYVKLFSSLVIFGHNRQSHILHALSHKMIFAVLDV